MYFFSSLEMIEEFEKLLENVTYDNATKFCVPITCGKVVKVYDGDTITIASKLPYADSPIYKFQVRLNGIDTPEIKGKTENEKILAKKTREALTNLIFGKVVELRNVSNEKYGRILADVYLKELNINQWLIENNYAVKYDGGKKIFPENWK